MTHRTSQPVHAGWFALYSRKGGGFQNALGTLASLGYIERGSMLSITRTGVDAISGQWTPLPIGRDLMDHWMSTMKRAAEKEVLRVVIEAWPEYLSAQEIATRTVSNTGRPYEVTGGGFQNALGKLRGLELVDKRGTTMKAADEFFEGGDWR